jgi:hypothetical protein
MKLVTGDHLFNLKLGKTVDEARDAASAFSFAIISGHRLGFWLRTCA